MGRRYFEYSELKAVGYNTVILTSLYCPRDRRIGSFFGGKFKIWIYKFEQYVTTFFQIYIILLHNYANYM
jgi:hypothetical protein